MEHIFENRLVISNLVYSLKNGGYIYIQIPNAIQKRLPYGRRFIEAHERWARKEHVGQTLTIDSLSSELDLLNCNVLIARYTEGFWGELRFVLSEMALNYFQSSIMYALLFPLLKLLGFIDSLIDYSEGNGIMILAEKVNHK